MTASGFEFHFADLFQMRPLLLSISRFISLKQGMTVSSSGIYTPKGRKACGGVVEGPVWENDENKSSFLRIISVLIRVPEELLREKREK